ncbi:MAG: acyltransferase [Clostridia bacterium]|nr:acyltransferase [Clostridia bacterium]
MKRNSSIDAVRAIACAAVLFIHCRFPAPVTQYMDALGRFAVPFFLMVSGFFAYRADREQALAAAGKHLRATVRLTLIGTLLYAVSNTIHRLRMGQHAFAWLDSLRSAEGVFNFFLFNRAIFLSSVMYYLFALIYVYAIFWLLLRYRAVRHAEKLIPVLLCACVVLTEFVGTPWYYSGNFLLTGLPFFLLGHYFARRGISCARARYFILPGIVLTLAEAVFFHNDVYCYIGTLVLSISLLLACLHQPEASVPKALVWFGRNCSVCVFLIHCAVRDQIYLFIPETPVHLWTRPLVILLVSCLLSIGFVFVRKKAKELNIFGKNV